MINDPEWRKGYRDGYDGAPALAIAPASYAQGWDTGNRDRRHGVARPELAHLVEGKPGSKWSDRR
jgi:hypothetical protein